MPRLPRPLRRLISLFRRNSRDSEMHREMAFHVESIAEEVPAASWALRWRAAA